MAQLFAHYEWPVYWGEGFGAPLMAFSPAARARAETERRQDGEPAGDPHLRSLDAVDGYHIEATDGEIGHVEDMLLDPETWTIRYLVIDTRNWLPGRKVLIPPPWIERFDWDGASVHVDLTRDEIERSPEIDPEGPIARAQEIRLFDHYGRPYYWF
jgi:hypothetical protein